MNEKKLTFIGHLSELRRALVVSAIAIVIGFGLAVGFWKILHQALMQPVRDLLPEGSTPMYIGVFEPIFYMLKLGLVGGLILASPVVFWQLWWFVSPGLYSKEKRLAVPFITSATLFFLGGAAFCYFIVLPNMVAYSVDRMTDEAKLMLDLGKYLSNAIMFILAFGLVFETPVMVFLISSLGLVGPRALARSRKYVLLGAFILAAVITPTGDPINQAFVGLPIYIMFELGILASRLVAWRKKRQAKDRGDPKLG